MGPDLPHLPAKELPLLPCVSPSSQPRGRLRSRGGGPGLPGPASCCAALGDVASLPLRCNTRRGWLGLRRPMPGGAGGVCSPTGVPAAVDVGRESGGATLPAAGWCCRGPAGGAVGSEGRWAGCSRCWEAAAAEGQCVCKATCCLLPASGSGGCGLLPEGCASSRGLLPGGGACLTVGLAGPPAALPLLCIADGCRCRCHAGCTSSNGLAAAAGRAAGAAGFAAPVHCTAAPARFSPPSVPPAATA